MSASSGHDGSVVSPKSTPGGRLQPPVDSPDRLDSWKEIAAYLGRSVLTAQRWEKSEGLPVHRHPHEKQASVFAFRSELDRWRRDRAVTTTSEETTPWQQSTELLGKLWRSSSSRHVLIAAMVIAALLGPVAVWQRRVAKGRAIREQTLPAIEQLIRSSYTAAAYVHAYRMAEDAERYISGDARLMKLWSAIAHPMEIVSEPPGAEIAITADGTNDTVHLGASPVRRARVPRGIPRWRATKAGYEPVEGVVYPLRDTLRIVLDRVGSVPAGMVRATGGTFDLGMTHLGGQPPFEVADYWIDKYEVTNREFKKFVDAGGYTNSAYWKEPFLKDGHRLSFAEAMRLFRDRTGRPGPATWNAGDFAQTQGDYPVTGVSWFEAMAYAEFVGKSLPTIFHWARAAGIWANSEIVPYSNFSEAGLATVGRNRAISAVGAYDMAGNAKEWCWNATTEGRFTLGGGWNEPFYMFNEADAQSPFSRAETFGFRLVKYITPPKAPQLAAVDYPRRDFSKETPVSDAVFKVIRGLYAYDKLPLHAAVDTTDDSNEHWRKETVTLDGPSGGERVTIYLFLPRNTRPPYQTVVFFPGSNVIDMRSSRDLQPPQDGAIIKSGRALAYPVYKATFERRDALDTDYPVRTSLYRDHVLEWHKDVARTLDYIETRRDLDASRIAYYGFSWGARLGPLFLALDPRFKAGVLVGGGLKFATTFPEADPLNFASRVTVPVLMVNGRYDYFFPLETSQRPLLRLLGTPTLEKRHVVLESGHAPPLTPVVTETLNWLDRYLGAVPRARPE